MRTLIHSQKDSSYKRQSCARTVIAGCGSTRRKQMQTEGEVNENGTSGHGKASSSEAVQLDGVARDALVGKEGRDLSALVALELDDLPHLLVVDERAVAGELLSRCEKYG